MIVLALFCCLILLALFVLLLRKRMLSQRVRAAAPRRGGAARLGTRSACRPADCSRAHPPALARAEQEKKEQEAAARIQAIQRGNRARQEAARTRSMANIEAQQRPSVFGAMGTSIAGSMRRMSGVPQPGGAPAAGSSRRLAPPPPAAPPAGGQADQTVAEFLANQRTPTYRAPYQDRAAPERV